MPDRRAAFVLVHGAFHAGATWHKLVPLLKMRGHVARAPDLPGAGKNARFPSSYFRRPLDAAAFASEPSPNAHVTQDERTRAVIAVVEDTARATGVPVVLVGHSLGGLTVTAVAETIPERLRAIVYVGAYMLPPGMRAGDLRQHASMAGTLIPKLQKAKPAEVGAMRIDPGSDDVEYLEQMRLCFCGDVSAASFALELAHLHCDEPILPARTPSPMTAERLGRVTRHYFRTLHDQAILIAAQDLMISTVDAALGTRTITHSLATSHEPYLSRPDAVAEALIAVQAGDAG